MKKILSGVENAGTEGDYQWGGKTEYNLNKLHS